MDFELGVTGDGEGDGGWFGSLVLGGWGDCGVGVGWGSVWRDCCLCVERWVWVL